MSNIIFLSSIAAAICWAISYMLVASGSSIHILLIVAFIGVAISLYIDIRKQENFKP